MDQRPNKPERPKRIITRDGRWEIIPDVEVLRIQQLDPQTENQRDEIITLGPKVRILYSAKTWKFAMKRVDEIVASGVRPERIECVFAERDTDRALREGRVEVIPLQPEIESDGLIR